MTDKAILTAYATRLGDNALVLGQRMIEWVAASPELEEELANANFALDYIGQARMFYTCAGESEGKGRTEDDFAYLRPEHEYRNLLLVEQPNGHFGDAIVRQFLFESGILAGVGGCFGALTCVGLVVLASEFAGLPLVIDPMVVGGTIAGSWLLGIVAGAYPAWQAARVEILDVLKV